MAASNVRAGGAFVEIFAKDSGFQKSLAKIRNQLQSFGQSLRSIGTVGLGAGLGIVAPLALATKSFADAGSEINDMAARTGISTDALQELGYAARQSGSSLGTVERGIRMMQKQAKAAGTTPEEMFMRMADQIGAIEDPTQRAAFALKHFGRIGTELIPMLMGGRDGLEAMRKKGRDLGIVLGVEDVTAADDLGDSIDSLWDSLSGVKNMIGAAVAPTMIAWANSMSKTAASVTAFINQNRGLVQGLLLGGVALTVVGGALIGLGVSFQIASFAVGGLMSAMALAGTILTAVAGSPLLLVAAGVLALAVAIPQIRTAAGDVFDWLIGGFSGLATTVTETVAAIVQALSEGDIAAAASVLWAGLRVAWLAGTQSLRDIWNTTTNNLAQIGTDVFYGFQSTVETVFSAIQETFISVANTFRMAWQSAINTISAGISKLWSLGSQSVARYFEVYQTMMAAVSGKGPVDVQKLMRPLETGTTADDLAEDQKRIANLDAFAKGALAAKQERAAESEARLKAIEDERKAAKGGLTEELEGRRTRAANELNAARDELAAQKNAIAEKAGMIRNFNAGVRGAGGLDGGLSGVSLGTFSARNIGQQAFGGLDKVTEATEATAENTEELVDLVRNGGLAFT